MEKEHEPDCLNWMVPRIELRNLAWRGSCTLRATGNSEWDERPNARPCGYQRFRGPRILRWKMCKKAMTVIVLLCSGVWAQAQQAQPGYAVLNTDQGSSRSGNSFAASPPEPATIGGPGGSSAIVPPPGMGYPMSPGMPVPPSAGPGIGGRPPMYSGPPAGLPDSPYVGDPGLSGMPTVGPMATFGTETVWFSMDYMAAWLQRPHLTTPLLTTGSTADANPGALQQPGTRILFGDSDYSFKAYSGFQAQTGVNLNDHWYLEADGFFLPKQTINASFSSDGNGNPLIARPVVVNGQNLTYFTSVPGAFAGSTGISADSMLWGIEAVARYKFEITPYLTGDFLLGYREMQLKESLTITDVLTPIVPSLNFLGAQVTPGPGTFVTDFDRFSTLNTFYGVDFGGRVRWQSGYDWFAITSYWKEALGSTHQNASINGATTLVMPGSITAVQGGILAQQSNIGSYSRSVFGSITEGGVSFNFTPCKYIRFEVGYSAMYWNSVLRPGNQLNANVTPGQVPTNNVFTGAAPGQQPIFTFRQFNPSMLV
jgi:hypothetical protein